MKTINFLNPFRRKKEDPKKEEEKKKDFVAIEQKIKENSKLRTVKFGDMYLSQKMLFMDKQWVNCILPPNQILPGRTIYFESRRNNRSKEEMFEILRTSNF